MLSIWTCSTADRVQPLVLHWSFLPRFPSCASIAGSLLKWFKDNPVSSARFLLLNVKSIFKGSSALCCLSCPSASHPDVEGILRQSETMKAAAQRNLVYQTTKSQERRRSGVERWVTDTTFTQETGVSVRSCPEFCAKLNQSAVHVVRLDARGAWEDEDVSGR